MWKRQTGFTWPCERAQCGFKCGLKCAMWKGCMMSYILHCIETQIVLSKWHLRVTDCQLGRSRISRDAIGYLGRWKDPMELTALALLMRDLSSKRTDTAAVGKPDSIRIRGYVWTGLLNVLFADPTLLCCLKLTSSHTQIEPWWSTYTCRTICDSTIGLFEFELLCLIWHYLYRSSEHKGVLPIGDPSAEISLVILLIH